MTFPVKQGSSCSFPMSLIDYNDGASLKQHATLENGDIKVKSSGSYANILTLPTTLSGQPQFTVALDSTETNSGIIYIWFKDQTSPPEWCETIVSIQTTTSPIEDIYTAVDDISTGATIINSNMVEISGSSDAADTMRDMSTTILRGTVVSDGGNSTTSFKTNLTGPTDFYNNGVCIFFTDNDVLGTARRINGFDNSTQILSVSRPFDDIPSDNSDFLITGYIES